MYLYIFIIYKYIHIQIRACENDIYENRNVEQIKFSKKQDL
jgi:hypothetical protein